MQSWLNISYPDPHTTADFCPLENPLGAARPNVMFLSDYGDASTLLEEEATFFVFGITYSLPFLSFDIFNCYYR